MRADIYLREKGYFASREAARAAIDAGYVRIDGALISKASEQIDEALPHDVDCRPVHSCASRGGVKLEAALDAFGTCPSGLVCLDIGASTGGFTDCLLRRGAEKVYAVDSGRGQLAPALKADPRVISLEGVNARSIGPELIPVRCGLAVMDVSFISQTLILPVIPPLLEPGGVLISLIKPQFEAGRGATGKKGIVKNPADRKRAAESVARSAAGIGLFMRRLIVSPIEGGDGNREYLALFVRDPVPSEDIQRIIDGASF